MITDFPVLGQNNEKNAEALEAEPIIFSNLNDYLVKNQALSPISVCAMRSTGRQRKGSIDGGHEHSSLHTNTLSQLSKYSICRVVLGQAE